MVFNDTLLEAGADLREARKSHPFVTELAAGTLDEEAFLTSARLGTASGRWSTSARGGTSARRRTDRAGYSWPETRTGS